MGAVIRICSALLDAVTLAEFIIVVEVSLEEGLEDLKLKLCSSLSKERVKNLWR